MNIFKSYFVTCVKMTSSEIFISSEKTPTIVAMEPKYNTVAMTPGGRFSFMNLSFSDL